MDVPQLKTEEELRNAQKHLAALKMTGIFFLENIPQNFRNKSNDLL